MKRYESEGPLLYMKPISVVFLDFYPQILTQDVTPKILTQGRLKQLLATF